MMTKTLIFLYSPSLAFTPFPNLPPGGKERQHCLKLFTLERRSKPSFSPMGGGACKAFPPWGIPITFGRERGFIQTGRNHDSNI